MEDVGSLSLRLRGLIAENSGEAERAKNAGLQLDPSGLLYLLSSTGDITQEHGCGVRTGSSPIKTSRVAKTGVWWTTPDQRV
jgi:hypothetical protein